MTTMSSGANAVNEGVNPIQIGIVGCGQIVTHHLNAIAKKLPGKIVVRAFVDPSPDRRRAIRSLSQDNGMLACHEDGEITVTEYNYLSELLLDDETSAACPVVFIAVPHDLHERLATEALKAGKIVVLEKPLAPTIDSCTSLVAAANSNTGNGMLIIAEQSPHWEEVSLAKQLIADGAIGKCITASSYYYESMRDNVTSGSVDADGGLGWRGSIERAGGGIVIDGGLHWLRPLREMLGPVTDVIGVVTYGLAPELKMEGESLAHALLKVRVTNCGGNKEEDSIVATYSANMLAKAPMAHDECPYFRITGTEGELIIAGDGLNPDGGGGLRMYNEESPKGRDLMPKDRQGGFFLGFGHLWTDIYRIVMENDTGAAYRTVMDAAADVSVALALYKSSASGQWEKTAFV